MSRWARSSWLFYGALGLLLVGAAVARVAHGSRSALERGRALEAQGDEALAALAYREAITWYLPGSPWVARGIEAMWALAEQAEERGDLVAARTIVGNLRGALYSIRSVYQPHEGALRICDEHLAKLLAATDERVTTGRMDLEDARAEFKVDVSRDHAPAVGWSLALGLGFLGWVFTTLVFLRRLLAPEDGLAWRQSLPWAALAVACAALWLAGAALA